MPGDPFRTDDLPLTPLSRAALTVARPLLEGFLGIGSLRDGYVRAQHLPNGSFPQRALRVLDVNPLITASDLRHVPARGPLIVVANHPHGALDGLVLAAALGQVRPDVRLLANAVLERIPEMRDLCFFVDPFGGAAAAARSRAGLRASHLWLRGGGALVAFPAGEVAHLTGQFGPTRVDGPWHDTIGRLAVHNQAALLPAFIEGGNSPLFYAAGRLHPLLRTLLLPRELMRQRGRTVRVFVGEPRLRHADDTADRARAILASVRATVDALGATATAVPRTPEALVAREVDALPDDSRLIETSSFAVYAVSASQIPATLLDIGRQREVAYRSVGEGTGHEVDLDDFDRHYSHLFLWDKEARKVAGAYRIGDVSAIVRDHGVNGLYTRQLFRYDERFLHRMGAALELGRSWIAPAYQKNYNALLLLWRGIGRFVVERSRAHVLFGPVSISDRYSCLSQDLLMAFLAQNHLDASLAELVEPVHPRMPPPATAPEGTVLPRSIDEANSLVSHFEADGKGVPVLLRQYLKLNARLIGFNVDPAFGDALDALMMVDLTAVDRGLLNRYLGKDGAVVLLERHAAVVHTNRAA